MPAFTFQARTRDGKAVEGIRAAADASALALELASERLFLVKAQVVTETARGSGRRRGRVRITRKDLAAFMLHLASYVEAGVPLLSALQDYRVPENPAVDAAIQDLRRRIEGGAALSEAMEAHPGLFSRLQVSMVRAGELSGRLDEAIREVIKLVEWEEAFAAQVKQASTYPIIVLSLIGLIILVVSVFALPGILKLLRDFNVALPLPTRIFMSLGDFMVNFGWVLVLLPPVGIIGFRMAMKDPELKLRWDTFKLRLPVVGVLITKLGLSRFANFFAAQYRSGIPIVRLLQECEGVTGNARLGLCVRAIREGVERGERLAVMAAAQGYFPQLVVRMLSIGEEAGNLEQTLTKVSQYFDAEVQASIKRLFQVIEPMLMVVLASVLVFVAVSILLPIYTLIGGINAGAR